MGKKFTEKCTVFGTSFKKPKMTSQTLRNERPQRASRCHQWGTVFQWARKSRFGATLRHLESIGGHLRTIHASVHVPKRTRAPSALASDTEGHARSETATLRPKRSRQRPAGRKRLKTVKTQRFSRSPPAVCLGCSRVHRVLTPRFTTAPTSLPLKKALSAS